MHPDVKNMNGRYSLFCSDDWIVENVVEFFANLPNNQQNTIMQKIFAENKKMNMNIQDRNNKNLVIKKVVLENILDEEDYEKEIEKFSVKQKAYDDKLEKLFENKFHKYLQENAKIPKTKMEEVDGGKRKTRSKKSRNSRTKKHYGK